MIVILKANKCLVTSVSGILQIALPKRSLEDLFSLNYFRNLEARIGVIFQIDIYVTQRRLEIYFRNDGLSDILSS